MTSSKKKPSHLFFVLAFLATHLACAHRSIASREVNSRSAGQPLKRLYRPGDRVAVIGAGTAGLAVARTLLSEGVSAEKIVVIEKDSSAGGKVRSVQVDGRPYELGAVIVVPKLYETLTNLAAKHHVNLRANPPSPGNYNLETRKLEPLTMSPEEKAAFMNDFKRYTILYETRYRDMSGPKGFSQTPPELEVTWMEFVKANQFERIHKMASNFIGGSGYLHPNALPTAAQILRMLTPAALTSLMQFGTQSFSEGFQQLLKLEAQDLEKNGVQFYYNTTIRQIIRNEKSTSLVTTGSQAPMEVEHVFYTGNLAYLPKLLAEPSAMETHTYGQIVFNDYRSFILRMEGMPNREMAGSFGYSVPYNQPIPMNRPVLSSKPYADSSIEIFYAYGAPGASNADVVKDLQIHLSRFGGKITEVIAQQKWDYFPHVTTGIKSFFDNVMTLQGSGGVWVAGEATSFTATIQVYEQGRDFAKLFVKRQL